MLPSALAAVLSLPGNATAGPKVGGLRKSGTVQMETACAPEVKGYFQSALSLLHSLDYAVFAYLQTAQDRNALEILDLVRAMEKLHEPNFAAAHAVEAIPARWTLERRRWNDAAALTILQPQFVNAFSFAVADTEFARAVGAARSGQIEQARKALESGGPAIKDSLP